MRKIRTKDILIILTAVLLILSCGKFRKSDQQNQQIQQQQQNDSANIKVPKDQYRIAVNLKDSKNQIIDLMQGSSAFEITFDGEGRFLAEIKYVDGRLLAVLADRTGSFKDKKTIEIPETNAYILEVECKGNWSVYRE